MYSSQPPKINLYPISDPLPFNVEVYRLKVAPSQDQIAAIFAYAESRRKRCYDFIGVLTVGMVELGGLEFCSKYTEDSFAAGQIVLSSAIQFPTPDQIVCSPLSSRIL
jgi:hypothetical protein